MARRRKLSQHKLRNRLNFPNVSWLTWISTYTCTCMLVNSDNWYSQYKLWSGYKVISMEFCFLLILECVSFDVHHMFGIDAFKSFRWFFSLSFVSCYMHELVERSILLMQTNMSNKLMLFLGNRLNLWKFALINLKSVFHMKNSIHVKLDRLNEKWFPTIQWSHFSSQ